MIDVSRRCKLIFCYCKPTGTIFTIVLLMRALDAIKYQDETNKHLSKLSQVDPARRGYYNDLCKKFALENAIENYWKQTNNVCFHFYYFFHYSTLVFFVITYIFNVCKDVTASIAVSRIIRLVVTHVLNSFPFLFPFARSLFCSLVLSYCCSISSL